MASLSYANAATGKKIEILLSEISSQLSLAMLNPHHQKADLVILSSFYTKH
jgi:hypothetical protein